MESRSFILPSALSSVLFGTGDQNSGASSLLAIRVVLGALVLACVGSGISAIHFHSRYEHDAQAARRLKSDLQSQIEMLDSDNRNLQLQVADLSETLEKTRIALALASRPSVSTTLPIPKVSPQTTVTSSKLAH